MNLISVLDQLAEHKPQNFAAPVLTKSTTRVFTLQESIPYWFDISVKTPGWYEIAPNGELTRIVRDLTWLERIKYLDQLKRFLVFALYPVDETIWICSPYNLSDAEQRGWHHAHPRRLYLVQGNLKPYDVVEARIMDNNLIYGDIAGEYWLESRSLPSRTYAEIFVEHRLAELRKQDEERARLEKRKTEHGRIEHSLETMGAKLDDWKRDVDGYEVTWSHNGRTHTMTLDEKLHVRSAGVCLAGRDNWHSLASIVSVMQDRDEGRGGYDGYEDY